MAVIKNGAEGLSSTISSSGTTIPAGTGETAMVASIGAGATIAPDTTSKAHGTQSFKMTPGGAILCQLKTPIGLNSSSGSTDANFLYPIATPSAEAYFLVPRSTGGVSLYSATWGTTGLLRIRNSSGILWTSTVAFTPTTFRRVALGWRINLTTPANSQVRLAAFPLDSDTPYAGLDSQWVTGAPSATAAVDYVWAGKTDTGTESSAFNIDDFRVDPTAPDLLAAFPLVVTGTLNPTTGPAQSQVTYTITSSGGNGTTVIYAVKIEFSALGDFSDTVVIQDVTTNTVYQSSGTFTYAPPQKGSYRFTPYAKQNGS